jgi:dimethylargininase
MGADSYIEAGDILMCEGEVLVGRSARTNAAGIAELAGILSDYGIKTREVFTPAGVLHFKTDCSLMDEDTVLATPRLAASGCFEGYSVIHTAEGEEAAANAIRFNDVVLMAAGFAGTREALMGAGYAVREIGNSECAKLDGGMSCLSLRFTPRFTQAATKGIKAQSKGYPCSASQPHKAPKHQRPPLISLPSRKQGGWDMRRRCCWAVCGQ